MLWRCWPLAVGFRPQPDRRRAMVAPDHGQLRASGLVSPDAQRDWPAGAGAAVPAAATGTDLAAAAVRDFPRHGSVSVFLRARSAAPCRHGIGKAACRARVLQDV